MRYIITFISILLSLGALDYLWLGVIIQEKIKQWMGPLMKSPISFGPAIAFYTLYSIAVLLFVVVPAGQKNSIYYAVGYGALLGLTAYMTYDFTNWTTLKDRPVSMVLPDIIRGVVVTTIVAVIGFYVRQKN